MEQRWIADIVGIPDPDSEGGVRPEFQGWPFQNRLRYNFGVTLPLKGEEIDNRDYYLFTSKEVLFSFGKNVNRNRIDQNRAQFGVGYQAGKFGRVEIGYLYQFIRNPDLEQVENNHTLTVSWISRFNFN